MRQAARRFACQPRRARSSISANRVPTALIAPPLRIPLAVTSISLLGYACARPLVALWLSFVTRAQVSVKRLWIHPLQTRVQLSGIHVKDRYGVPLGGMESAQIDIGGGLRYGGEKQLELTVVNPKIVAVFDGIDLRTSNWTRWMGQGQGQRQRQGDGKEGRREVKVKVKGGVRVSVRAGEKKIVEETKLEGVKVGELRAVKGIGKYIDGWVGKTLENGRGRVEKQFKKSVRRYVRRVRGGFEDGLRVSRERVKVMKEGLEFVEEFVLKDLPNTRKLSDQIQGVRNVLGGIEGLLKGGDNDGDVGRVNERSGEDDDDNSVGEFRELNEGDAK